MTSIIIVEIKVGWKADSTMAPITNIDVTHTPIV